MRVFLPSIVQQKREFSDYWRMQACLFISCIECSLRLTVVYRIVSPLRSCFFSSSGLWYSGNCFPILYDGANDRLDGTTGSMERVTGSMERTTGLGNRLDGTSDRLGQPA